MVRVAAVGLTFSITFVLVVLKAPAMVTLKPFKRSAEAALPLDVTNAGVTASRAPE